MRIIYKGHLTVFILTFTLSFQISTALDNAIASASLSNLQGMNGRNAAYTQEALGVESHAVGDQSAMSGDSMGVLGKRIASMTLLMKPQCSADSVLKGLDGSILRFPCQGISSTITGKLCLPKLEDCSNSQGFTDITIPVGAKQRTKGYDFSASCHGICTIKMSKESSVITNADSIKSQSTDKAKHNDQYNLISEGYKGKNGYSQQQAYLKSFSKDGANNLIGTQCINGVSGYLKSGEYHTCDNAQSGSFKSGCHEEKTCSEWKTNTRDIITYHQCILKAKVSDIHCDKKPVVTFNEVVTPAKDMAFSGSFTGYPNGSYYGGDSDAYFTYPYTGVLKSFSYSITGSGSFSFWVGEFIISIDGIIRSVYTKNDPVGLFYFADSNHHLNTSVTQNQQAHFYMDGTGSSTFPMQYKVTYNGVIEIPEQRHKEPHTTWQSSCPTL